jgi:hypothetical protein
MPSQGPKLDLGDTTELGELLAFLGEWLAGPDAGQLEDSLRRHIGTYGYDLTALRQDLARFTRQRRRRTTLRHRPELSARRR